MRHAAPWLLIVALSLWGASAVAQDLFVYPSKGQTPEQQEQDEFARYKWAKQESGVDPGAPPKDGDPGRVAFGALGGAAKGAALGAAVGAVAKGGAGAKKGAVIGGTVGGVGGAGGAVSQQKKEQQRERSNFGRAFTACMEARGYVVR
jgi:hypothetical protein